MSALRPHISLESRARRFDYSAADARGQNATPLLLGDPDRKQAGFIGRGWDEEDLKPEYKTILPVSKIASTLNGKWRTDVKVSSDAGE